jgi:hypothetical protein
MELQTFQAGKTYSTRSACDHNCVVSITVARRTAKTLFTSEGKRLGIGVYEGREFVKPWGSYSMAPVVDASDVEAA